MNEESKAMKDIILSVLRREEPEIDEEMTALVRKQMVEDMKNNGVASWHGAYAKVITRSKDNE